MAIYQIPFSDFKFPGLLDERADILLVIESKKRHQRVLDEEFEGTHQRLDTELDELYESLNKVDDRINKQGHSNQEGIRS